MRGITTFIVGLLAVGVAISSAANVGALVLTCLAFIVFLLVEGGAFEGWDCFVRHQRPIGSGDEVLLVGVVASNEGNVVGRGLVVLHEWRYCYKPVAFGFHCVSPSY